MLFSISMSPINFHHFNHDGKVKKEEAEYFSVAKYETLLDLFKASF